jgi:hypothetical protein
LEEKYIPSIEIRLWQQRVRLYLFSRGFAWSRQRFFGTPCEGVPFIVEASLVEQTSRPKVHDGGINDKNSWALYKPGQKEGNFETFTF